MATKILGEPIKRRDDPEYLVGEAKFTADITLPKMTYAVILHSEYAHAIIKSIDTSEALKMPGVLKVITGEDTKAIFPLPVIMNPGREKAKFSPHPWGLPAGQTVLAIDRVRYIGENVAVVVAETRQQAYDALSKIKVEYEPLPVVIDPEEALKPSAPQLHETVPNNLNQYISFGDKEAAEKAIAEAEVVIKKTLKFQRVQHHPVEPRNSIADYNPETGDYTLWTDSQIPAGNKFLLTQLIMFMPYNKLRVIVPHTGGSFGSKGYMYFDTAVMLFLAKALGRPVKWTDDRLGMSKTTVQARDQKQYVTLAGTKDGKITALYCTNYSNLGAYSATNGPGAPTSLTGRSITGSYAIPNPFYEVNCVFTNKVLNGPMRGAGRSEAIFLIERMIEMYSKEIGMSPVEIRKKNFVKEFPYPNGLGWTYDTGNYEVALDKALEMIDYQNLNIKKAEAKARGKRLGIGIGSYTAIAGVGPSSVMGSMIGLNGSTWGSTHLRVHPSGDVTMIIGSQPHGQGHTTSFAQIVAEEFGINIEQIEVLHSDTRGSIYAQGSYGSRSYSVEGATVHQATQKILAKAKKMAAHIFKVAEDQIVVDQGKFSVQGKPEEVKTLKDIALALWYAWDIPAGLEPGLEVITFFDPPDFNYPFGTHIAEIEIDEQTGEIEVTRYIAVDDFGNVGNPLIVDGQTHGSIHLGISQALYEETIYNAEGKILTDELHKYAIAKASQLPKFETARTVTPTPHNSLGAKGAGDVANPVVAPTIVNAICDALSDLGVTEIEMPVTPEKVWRLMNK